jgi:hypothetical protein
MGRENKPKKIAAVFACYMLLTLNFNQLYASGPGSSGGGQGSGGSGTGAGGGVKRNLASLKTVPVPGPTVAELSAVIQNKAAAIALGKAFFWEMQFGSDGNTACATCHFNAGADSRSFNQTDPGLRRVDGNGNPSADSTTFKAGFGANHQLSISDFPLHRLADANNQASALLSENNNIVGSPATNEWFV